MPVVSFFPLTWPALQAHVRRRWFDAHRGEVPARRPDILPGSAPIGIAICMHLSVSGRRFATEAEAYTYRYVGPRAQTAVSYWQFAGQARENCRIIIDCIRRWRERKSPQAELDTEELRRRWAAYRKCMRRQVQQVAWVRERLTPRHAPAMAIAAE